MVNVYTSNEHAARVKQRYYEERMRMPPRRIYWDEISVVVAFFKYRLARDTYPTKTELRDRNRTAGLPSMQTVKKYGYEEICEAAEEKYRRHIAFIEKKKESENAD